MRIGFPLPGRGLEFRVFTSDPSIRLSWIKRLRDMAASVGLSQPLAGSAAEWARTKGLPIRMRGVIVDETFSDSLMRSVVLFAGHFYFSHSSPQAVE